MKKTALKVLALYFIVVSTVIGVEFSADEVTAMAGGVKGKIYYKNSTTRRNESMGMIMILKYPSMYQIFTNTKKYIALDMEEELNKSKNPMAGLSFEEIVKKNDMKKVGSETIQDFDCIIYEGDFALSEKIPPMHMKIWYSQKLEYALKVDMTLPAPMGTISSHIENIKVEKQADALFEIPSGYTKVDTIQEAMGIPNFK
ncbi:MAG: hypothetical protein U9R27_04420 [Campylobacterota bacterium]|nr:hypothetical protein [Campylobacterota bacterium]